MRNITYYYLRIKRSLSKKDYLEYAYYLKRNIIPNLKKPTNISEFILQKILSNNIDQYSKYADKLEVRNYIESKGLTNTLPYLYGRTKNAEQIDYNNLPNKFVIKTNNSCGTNIVCLDKKNLDKESTNLQLNSWIKNTSFKYETHYNLIIPEILIEEFIEDYNGYKIPIDYKFMCFNGKVKLILLCLDRSELGGGADSYIFDTNWNFIQNYHTKYKENPNFPKPHNFDDLISTAEILANDFDFVRVDLYNSKRGIIFSELTFTPGMGILSTFTIEALEYIYEK